MKAHTLFCCLLAFITCCVFTWKAENALNQVLGYIVIIILMAGIAKSLIAKLNA